MEYKYNFSKLAGHIEHLKSKLHIAVIHGGDKNEADAVMYRTHNPRSWKSYEVVAKDIQAALKEAGFKHVLVMPDDMSLLNNLKKEKIHFVWLNTGGVQGYIPTAHAASMLEMAGIPYIGHNPLNSAILDNKHIFKFMCQKFNIPTSPFLAWSRSSLSVSKEEDLKAISSAFGDYIGPFIVKPTSGRASIHIYVVESLEDLFKIVNQVHQVTQNLVVIEKYLPGREYAVSICGPVMCSQGQYHKKTKPYAFSIIERVLDKDERIFTSMDKKPITQDRIRICNSKNDNNVYHKLIEIAQQVYTNFFLETLVRLDFRADTKGNLYVLEANPKPDLKKPTPNVTSLTCIGLEESNMSYIDLITGLLADRLDYLFTYRKKNIKHIIDMLS